MWLIASIPFWFLGGIFVLSAIAAVALRRPSETDADVSRQIVSGIFIAGIWFIIAAKIAS